MSILPPFYENFDNSHCFQCSLRGALEAFHPEKIWTWPELEELTGKKPNLYTWWFKACAELPALSYEIRFISDLDVKAFAEDAIAFIHSFYSPQAVPQQIDYSDIPFEEKNAADMLAQKSVIQEQRSFTVQDIKDLIEQGYMVIPQINANMMADISGYSGHYILIFGIEGENAIYHDSGLGGAQLSARAPLAKIVNAAIDNGKMEGLIAIRPKLLNNE